MKLLLDMNISPGWVATLYRGGIKSFHWSTVGAKNASDAEIMAYARANEFVVLTQNLDFGAILAVTHAEKPSVVQIRADDLRPDILGQQVIASVRQMEAELESGALLTVDANRTRLRLLPFERR